MTDPILLPGAAFHGRALTLTSFPQDVFYRVYPTRHPDPLGFKPSPSRFSDPEIGTPGHDPYGTIYFGQSIEVCVLEAIIRDEGVGLETPQIVVSEKDLRSWTVAQFRLSEPWRLLDLTGGGAIAARVPTDAVRAQDHTLGRAWSKATFDHPDGPDGILYSSRLNEETNAAIFDRALPKVSVEGTAPLFDYESELARILDKYAIVLE
jgi:hypothetical protein